MSERQSAEKDAPLMTEAEWRQRERQRECATYGHEWNIIQTVTGVPVSLACGRACGAPTYRVFPPDVGEGSR